MVKDSIILNHTGKSVKKGKENFDLNLPAGVQALIETRVNSEIAKLRELNRNDLKDLARKSKRPWIAMTAIGFVFSIVMTLILWLYAPDKIIS